MTPFIVIIELVFSLLLAACGGGSSQAVNVTIVGDSLDSELDHEAAKRMQQDLGGGYALKDFSWPSRGAAPSLTGLPPGQPYTTFADLMQQQRPDVAVILFGGAEVIGESDPAQFEQDMRQLIALAHGVGAKVVLATIIHHPIYEQQEAPFNAAIERLAVETHSELADVYAQPVGGFLEDGIHPDLQWTDQRADLIAQSIRAAAQAGHG